MVRLQEILADVHEQSSTAIRDHLRSALEHFRVRAQADDTAIVMMHFTGAGRGRAWA
jgi:serine phosphatase RsbU (regulator of sigma subunit)